MNIGELKSLLKSVPANAAVYFDFCSCVPTVIDSWRGIYSEPALGWAANTDSDMTAGDLLQELELATSGKVYYGWKGGEYEYDDHHELHIDNPGRYTSTGIERVTVHGDWMVLIHTTRED